MKDLCLGWTNLGRRACHQPCGVHEGANASLQSCELARLARNSIALWWTRSHNAACEAQSQRSQTKNIINSMSSDEAIDADKLFGGDKGKEAIVRAWRCAKTFLANDSLMERYEGTSHGGLPLAAWELVPELSNDTLMTFARAPSWKGLRPAPSKHQLHSRRPGEESIGNVKFEFYCCGVCYCCLRQDGIVAVMRPAEFQTAEIVEYALPAVKTCGFGPGPDPDWSNVSVKRTSRLSRSKYVYEEASSRTISGPGKHAGPGNTRVAHHPNRYRVIWEFVGGETAKVGCHHRNSPALKVFHERTVKLMQQGAPENSAMKRE